MVLLLRIPIAYHQPSSIVTQFVGIYDHLRVGQNLLLILYKLNILFIYLFIFIIPYIKRETERNKNN